jgi:hypothetical protein
VAWRKSYNRFWLLECEAVAEQQRLFYSSVCGLRVRSVYSEQKSRGQAMSEQQKPASSSLFSADERLQLGYEAAAWDVDQRRRIAPLMARALRYAAQESGESDELVKLRAKLAAAKSTADAVLARMEELKPHVVNENKVSTVVLHYYDVMVAFYGDADLPHRWSDPMSNYSERVAKKRSAT